MGETETLHFFDFRISGRVPERQNHYYLSLENPETSTNLGKSQAIFAEYYFIHFKISNFDSFVFLKSRAPKTRRSV